MPQVSRKLRPFAFRFTNNILFYHPKSYFIYNIIPIYNIVIISVSILPYNLMILGKITTLYSSMMGRPDLRAQLMEDRTRKIVLSRARRTKFQVYSSLAKPRPESARQ